MIVFRLLYTRAEPQTSSTRFDEDGNLPTRGLIPTQDWVFDSHLSWDQNFPSPFLSTFCSWRRIMDWRRWMLSHGGVIVGNLYIVAIDTDRVKNTRNNACYDAYNVARRLGYTDTGIHPRRQLSHHRDEYLIYGGISADDYAILAIFPAGGDEMRHQVGGHWIPLPGAYLEYLLRLASHGPQMTVVEDLATEIYSSTGVYSDRQLAALLTAMRC
jgi:hypothetical protein